MSATHQAAALAERERQLRRRQSEVFVDQLVRGGVLPAGHRRAVVELMEHFDGERPVDGERTPLEQFQAFLSSLPRVLH